MDLLEEISNTGLAAHKLADLDRAARDRNTRILRNYADLLYDSILNEMHPQRHRLLEELEDTIRKDRKGGVKIWSYSVTFHEGLDPITMSGLSELGNHTVVFDDGVPMSVDRIIQNTDILWRLAFTFGIRFRVRRRQGMLRVYGGDRKCYEMELWLEYVHELTERETESLLSAYKGVMNRPLYQGTLVRMTPRY